MTSTELISELRATRPSAGEALRERVQTIASRVPPPRRSLLAGFSPRRMSAIALPAAVALALASAGAIGLARSGDDDRVAVAPVPGANDYPSASANAESQPRGALTDQARAGAATKGAAPAVGPTVGRPQRYSAELTLEVPDADALSEATQRALTIVRGLGGYAVSTAFDAEGENGGASLVVRVPTARVQDALVRLSQLGTIVGQQVQIDDLGEQVDQLAQREGTLRERIARLSARLQQPDLDDETRGVLRARRAEAQRELASVRQQRAAVNREAALATISLSLRTDDEAAVPGTRSRLDRALDRTVDILAWEGIALLYAAVVAGPFVLLGLLLWAGSRVRRRREDERLLTTS